MRKTVLAMLVVLAACGGGEPGATTAPETSEPPASTVTTSVPTTVVESTTTTTRGQSTTLPEEPTVPTSTSKPVPGDVIGEVFVTGADVLLLESDPVQVRLAVSAQLPTPCHEAAWDVDDDGTTITVTLYSLVDADVICADVIQEVELQIDLGVYPVGQTRTVVLNGETVETFTT